MNKLKLDMSIVAENDGKTLLKTTVPLESLDQLVKTKGESAVGEFIWSMFNRLTEELRKK